jgi:hypothetical protein
MKTVHAINKSPATQRAIRGTPPSATKAADAHSNRISQLACLIFAMLAMAYGSVRAESPFEGEFDDTEKPWQEIAIQLPALPAPENLLPFETISATATQSFAVDAKSLTTGSDGVVRYTVVSTSASGAKNISYEGIRCHSLERKLYAFGQANGTWSRARRDKWETIPRHSTNNHHATLALEYFCDGRAIAGSANEIVHRLKWRQPIDRGS